MTEPNSQDHWHSLISDLGATPPTEEESLRQPGPTQPQPARIVKPASARRHHEAPAADWDRIADELGVAPAPRPIEPPRASVVSSVAATETPRQVSITPERGEESPNFFDERFDFEEPFDLLESTGENAAAPPAVGPQEKRPHKRRRRRRPGRESGDRDKHGPDGHPKVDDRSAGLISATDDDSFRVDAGEGAELSGVELPPAESSASERRRSKHRRPRRGQKHRSEDGLPSAAAGAPSVEGGERETVKWRDEDDFHGYIDASEDETEERERYGEQTVRAGFRGIPTWSATVGMIIEKNLESRAKRPRGDSHPGRGNKRRS